MARHRQDSKWTKRKPELQKSNIHLCPYTCAQKGNQTKDSNMLAITVERFDIQLKTTFIIWAFRTNICSRSRLIDLHLREMFSGGTGSNLVLNKVVLSCHCKEIHHPVHDPHVLQVLCGHKKKCLTGWQTAPWSRGTGFKSYPYQHDLHLPFWNDLWYFIQ